MVMVSWNVEIYKNNPEIQVLRLANATQSLLRFLGHLDVDWDVLPLVPLDHGAPEPDRHLAVYL